ncbi:MAG: sensor domain-containing diguanylate cyclase, partial [Sedimentisphaerales bacterium]|nr:sensor domain-containing diguanylate cyclase [Sedimentisphaerales bacterium]
TKILNENFHKTLLDSIFDAVYVVDALGNIIYWNHCCARITGYEAPEMIGQRFTDSPFASMDQHENFLGNHQGGVALVLENGMSGTWKGFVRRKNGQRLPIEAHIAPMRSDEEQILGAVVVFRDISAFVALEDAHRQLLQMSRKDQLTSMFNRGAISDVLKAEFDRASRYEQPLSVVMVDIDFFKRINDRYGHDAGDKVLAKIGSILTHNMRKPDMVGRWGGEEFLIITPNSQASAAAKLAQRIRKYIAEIPVSLDVPEPVTASFGIAQLLPDDTSPDQMLYRADMAMYQAKEHGRNQVVIAKDNLQNPNDPDTQESQ